METAVQPISKTEIENRFAYRSPTPEKNRVYGGLWSAAHELAQRIMDETPASREQTLAVTKLEEAVLWANAALARKEH